MRDGVCGMSLRGGMYVCGRPTAPNAWWRESCKTRLDCGMPRAFLPAGIGGGGGGRRLIPVAVCLMGLAPPCPVPCAGDCDRDCDCDCD
jgi:hypothetical protein